MFYTYAEKQGNSLFGSWQTRQVAFDTLRRYLYYSEPVQHELPAARSHTLEAGSIDSTPITADHHSGGAVVGQPARTGVFTPDGASAERAVSEVTVSPAAVAWRRKFKVTGVLPLATRPEFDPSNCVNERDLYRLEIQGESRPMVRGETPPAGPLLCSAAGLSQLERSRCNLSNDAFIRDPFFLKELFDSLRDQFEDLAKERARAVASVNRGETTVDLTGSSLVDAGVQTLVSPRGHKGEPLHGGALASVQVVLRSRDEREFRRFWFVLQSVLGYDKLIVRPYRGLPPYDPRNGVAFAHIPMSVWHTFQSLDKAVFYTFMRGNMYVLEEPSSDSAPASATAFHAPSRSGSFAAMPRLKRILERAYLCTTHDSVLCMRETGSIPRWLRLAEVQEFHWDLVARDAATDALAPFCVFVSDAPIPDLFFQPLPPAHGTDAIAAYTPLVDVRRLACVIHDSCFASLSTRRVIRMREVQDASIEAYVARTMQERQRRPTLQRGEGCNSTLSCPLPKEQLAAVWQQVQAELLERGNMANRAAIPIYASNARDVELSEDQLSTVERELDDKRERRDDIVGMPLELARQLERRGRGAAAAVRRAHRSRHQHRDNTAPVQRDPLPPLASVPAARGQTAGAFSSSTAAATRVMPLTMELLQTPQLQSHFAGDTAREQVGRAALCDEGEADSVASSSHTESTVVASEYSSYLAPGARYISREEWLSGAYASTGSPLATDCLGDAPRHPAQAIGEDRSAASTGNAAGGAAPRQYNEERTLNEIIGRSMAALEETRAEHHRPNQGGEKGSE
ncbi:hypothetical protein GH5_01645 [Leishmania sp. Ghana 2012 LV757]|uniref:hypothetical protein n=1 Tax=Leishmania sp. Ghana 2012 LV757 TaxID=2803181 RepID=UPI001B427497|nr:hypothetical protein GH5_01632 [Leishmania sp. Ghana 2012 LV757]KAG5497113.1 hypothetical protein GH5_01645 [Leishmania sp. Ghana 2012 LV757]